MIIQKKGAGALSLGTWRMSAVLFLVFVSFAVSGCALAVEFGKTESLSVKALKALKIEDPAMRGIARTVQGMIDSLNKQDVRTLRKFYVPDASAVFYGAAQAKKAVGTKTFMKLQDQCLGAFKTVSIEPDDMQVKSFGKLAVATLTGRNNNVFLSGEKSVTDWRWTLVLRNMGGDNWQVAHEHLSVEAVSQ